MSDAPTKFDPADIAEIDTASSRTLYGIRLPSGEKIWDSGDAMGIFYNLPFNDLNTETQAGRARQLYREHLEKIGLSHDLALDLQRDLTIISRRKIVGFTEAKVVSNV